jgi:anaerobic magnesium-protoporphyrin IX monomethyl ester cyclase
MTDKIILVNPKSPFLMDSAVMPPLGIMYLAAVLKEKGVKVEICDMGLGEEPGDGDLYITGTTPQEAEMLKLQRNPYTVVGGPHASVDPEALKNKFDLVVVGEGEEVIHKIIKTKPEGMITTPRIRNLDSLPFPDRTKAGKYHWLIGGEKATTMITSRGCTGRCSFCCKAVMDKGIYFRSPKNIIEEVKEIKAMGFGAVMFYDDSLAMKRDRLFEICRSIEKVDIIWRCFIRGDQVNQEMLNAMAQSGCYEILIGTESGSQKILNSIRKNETVTQNKNAIMMAKKAGIRVKALMIAGLPGETWDTIEESRQFLEETKPDDLDVTILSVYKGCDIYQNPHRYDLNFREPTWYKGRNDEYESTVQTSHLSESDIVKAQKMLFNIIK